MATVDLTVRGAGIFGLSIAWACARRGAKVQVVDPKGPGAGASGGVLGALAPHTPENWNEKKAFQFESLVLAESFWAEVDAVSGRSSGYGRTGRLQPLMDDKAIALARARAETATEFWGETAKWQVIDTADGPWGAVSPTGLLVHDTLSARLHPYQACQSLAQALRITGTPILESAPEVGPTLWATGVQGLADLSAHFSQPIGNAVKGQAAVLDFALPDAPQLFTDALHIIPHADGTTAIGATSEREGEGTGTDGLLDDLITKARRVCPLLEGASVLERWAGLRPRARSRAPLLGPWPERPGHFIANGGFKIGFGMAPLVAEVMADLILEGQDRNPEPFRLEVNFRKD